MLINNIKSNNNIYQVLIFKKKLWKYFYEERSCKSHRLCDES